MAIKVHLCPCLKCPGASYHWWQHEQTRCNRQTIAGTLSPSGRALTGRYLRPRRTCCRIFHLVHKNWRRRSGMSISEWNCLQITDYCYLILIVTRLLWNRRVNVHYYHRLTDGLFYKQEHTIIDNCPPWVSFLSDSSPSHLSPPVMWPRTLKCFHRPASLLSPLPLSPSHHSSRDFQFYPTQTTCFWCSSTGSDFWGCP